MDLTTEAIHDVIHPTAIYSYPIERLLPAECSTTATTTGPPPPEPSWEDSQLNPKNRIHSLSPLKSPLWRIDGSAGRGTQFFAVPLFVEDAPPMRFDVFVAEKATTESPMIRALLDLDSAFHARDVTRVRRQAISSYITRALQVWTTEVYGLDRVRRMYDEEPFGTRIMFKNLPLNVRDVDIHIGSMHNLEFHQCSLRELAEMWKMDLWEMPRTLDIYSLVYVRQLQDSVCVVRYRQRAGSDVDPEDQLSSSGLWALKALTSSVKYLYHELRNLLSMPAHPNVLSRPVRLVTKRTKINDKREVVVGFLEPYHSGMNLRDSLPLLRMNNRLQIVDQVRWAREVCSGLLHIRKRGKLYYPDMRLDQVALTSDNQHPVILDFEQRGVWCEFAAPEVNALEHVLMLATDPDEDDEDDSYAALAPPSPPHSDDDDNNNKNKNNNSGDCDNENPIEREAARRRRNHALRGRYADLLTRVCPGWRTLAGGHDEAYANPAEGYNVAWVSLTETEREHAEVYMLARLLWCVFEGMSAPQRGAVWQSYRNEPEREFPAFTALTPPELRGLIGRCTRGRRPQLSGLVVRDGSKLVLQRGGDVGGGLPQRGDDVGAKVREIRSVAKEFWEHEVEWAEGFLLEREERMKNGTWNENIFDRPTLEEVDHALDAFQRQMLG